MTKEDAETGKEAQGKAILSGAEYALLYEDGIPVKWTDASHPILTIGSKKESDEIIVHLYKENLRAGIENLPLGKYVWKETKAQEGYQKGKEIPFEIMYKNQQTEVITTNQTSKEKVIKFTLQGFKYVQSKPKNTHAGYNGIEFSLMPIDDTNGKAQATTQTNPNGRWGWGIF